MSFITTGFRELGLKIRRQRTRLALRRQKRSLQRREIALGREGTEQAANFPELRNEIVALKKLEQEQKEVALRIAQIEEGIRKIEHDRQRNLQEQSEALLKLEAEKKPIQQRRDEAKHSTEICDRELNAVERRIEANETADRDLLKQLSELQAATPPPADLEAKSTSIGSRRARLPDERAELVRARMGSGEACRQAKEKLAAAEAELSALEKNIEKVRAEYDARDKAFGESVKSQQESVKQARTQIQTVEERKNPAYLNIGRHLATQAIAPPNAPHLLTEVQEHRRAVERHVQHAAELAVLSGGIDKQELRKFYFSLVSVMVLLPLILLLVVKSSSRREWLPNETEAILAVNVDRFERDDLPKRWHKDQPDAWAAVWSGLTGAASRAPGINLPRDAAKITRAVTSESGRTRDFILIETRSDVSPIRRALGQDSSFERKSISGLPVWERSDVALSCLGPTILAVGASKEVDELVRVRLGMQVDLKIRGELFDRLESLEHEGALRLICRDTSDLPHLFHPIFTTEFLDHAQMLGMVLTLQNPVRAHILLKTTSAEAATQFARELHNEAQRWLRLQDSDLLLYAQPPDISHREETIDLRFVVPENSARLLLQRIARSDTPTVVAEAPPSQ